MTIDTLSFLLSRSKGEGKVTKWIIGLRRLNDHSDEVREEQLNRVFIDKFIVCVWFSKIPNGLWLMVCISGLYLLYLFTNWYVICTFCTFF